MTPPASVVLRGQPISLASEVGKAFVSDCARYTEGLIAEIDIKKKWDLSEEAWRSFEQDLAILEAVRRERERRVMNGVAATEAARNQFVRASPSMWLSISAF